MRSIHVRLPDEVHEAVRKEAYDSRRSMNSIVEEAVRQRAGWRAALAEAWDEGVSDGVWNMEHEGMIERGLREEIRNPYRDGDK